MYKGKYSKGQIFTSPHKDAEHPLVYWKQSVNSQDHFIGLMLTKANIPGKNIKMKPEHFTDGFIFKDTHVVGTFLDKPNEYEPLKPIGRLTPKGIGYIYDNIKIDESVLWDEYLKR